MIIHLKKTLDNLHRKQTPLKAICRDRGKLLMPSTSMNRQCIWSKFCLFSTIYLKMTGKKTTHTFCMNHSVRIPYLCPARIQKPLYTGQYSFYANGLDSQWDRNLSPSKVSRPELCANGRLIQWLVCAFPPELKWPEREVNWLNLVRNIHLSIWI
jgi:hypothetical protein